MRRSRASRTRARVAVSVLGWLVLITLSWASAVAAEATSAPATPLSGGAVVGELTAEEIARRVQTFYDKAKTFQAEFKQRYFIRSHNRTKNSRGKVAFEKPGKMSWRYKDNGNRVVSDGQKLFVYEHQNKQMFKQMLAGSAYPAALSFLVGQGKLVDSFKLQKLDPVKLKFKKGYVLLGEPREQSPAYQNMLLYVDAKTYQVRRVMLIDVQGNRNRFDFLEPVINRKLRRSEFRFSPPAGTRIIRP